MRRRSIAEVAESRASVAQYLRVPCSQQAIDGRHHLLKNKHTHTQSTTWKPNKIMFPCQRMANRRALTSVIRRRKKGNACAGGTFVVSWIVVSTRTDCITRQQQLRFESPVVSSSATASSSKRATAHTSGVGPSYTYRSHTGGTLGGSATFRPTPKQKPHKNYEEHAPAFNAIEHIRAKTH